MIYIQKDNDTNLPHHFDCACALYGAIDSALNYKLITFEEVSSGKFDNLIKQNLFVGSVEFMREVFSRVGLLNVRLPINSNREHDLMTLKQVKEYRKNGKHFFIKPIEIKLFTGFVYDDFQYSIIDNLPEDTIVMAYEPFIKNILSEWRIYVHNHEMIDSRVYSGSFEYIPIYNYIREIIEQNKKTFPVSYTIDAGVLDVYDVNDNTVIVEYNDMWAIGNYGIPNDLYLQLLKDRYFEIMRNYK